MKNIIKVVVASSLLLTFNQTLAGTTTWEWDLKDSFSNQTQSGDSSFDVSGTNSDNGITLSAELEAFADTGGSNDNKIKRAGFIEFSGGLGIINQDEDGAGQQHAFDNRGSYLSNGVQQSSTTPDYDMALISFDTSVELTGIDFGYRSDGDFTLLAYTGAGNFSGSNLNNSTWAAESNSGNWLTVGHYNGGEYANNTYYAVNSGGASSKYWLLGAYNSVFGESGVSNIDKHDDAFKVRKLRADTHYEEVSSPTAFGLLLFGLAGLYIRRNKKC